MVRTYVKREAVPGPVALERVLGSKGPWGQNEGSIARYHYFSELRLVYVEGE